MIGLTTHRQSTQLLRGSLSNHLFPGTARDPSRSWCMRMGLSKMREFISWGLFKKILATTLFNDTVYCVHPPPSPPFPLLELGPTRHPHHKRPGEFHCQAKMACRVPHGGAVCVMTRVATPSSQGIRKRRRGTPCCCSFSQKVQRMRGIRLCINGRFNKETKHKAR